MGPSSVSVEVIPRSREVGQSYVTSVFTTLYSLMWAFWMVTRHRPQLVGMIIAAAWQQPCSMRHRVP